MSAHPSAIVIILPQVRLDRPGLDDWEEQHCREVTALIAARRKAPPRTRPVLVDLGKYK